MKRLAALTLAGSLALTGAAGAQIASGGVGLQGDQPMDATAEAFERVEGQCLVVMTGNVEVVQGANRLRSPRLDVHYTRPAAGGRCGQDVDRIVAAGPVYYVTPTQNARGDNALFNAADDRIVMTGNVVLTQGRDVLTGERLIVNTRTNDAAMQNGGGNGRVRAVIFPNAARRPAGQAAPAPARPAG